MGAQTKSTRRESDLSPVGTALTVGVFAPLWAGPGSRCGERKCAVSEECGAVRGGRGTRRGRKGGGARVKEPDREVRREQRGYARRRGSRGVAWPGLGTWPGTRRGQIGLPDSAQSRPAWAAVQVHFVRWAEGTEPRQPAGPARPGVRTPRIPRERVRRLFGGRPGRAGAIHVTATPGISNMQGQDNTCSASGPGTSGYILSDISTTTQRTLEMTGAE
ncbi:uncharacterized protein LOC125079785 [Lutra lutra]|uniref:uncharacterized protein LOC125079785 n=1 Tax=Lutra lutra TaxID=9657 RepID=UPI001FD5E465|nr:uncharacterized protein LOC125079785 [Lutra lutra]